MYWQSTRVNEPVYNWTEGNTEQGSRGKPGNCKADDGKGLIAGQEGVAGTGGKVKVHLANRWEMVWSSQIVTRAEFDTRRLSFTNSSAEVFLCLT